jgi:hypothetical protein
MYSPGFNSQQGQENFSFPKHLDKLWTLLPYPSPHVNGPGCEADHPPPSTAKVKNGWSYTVTPHQPMQRRHNIAFMHNKFFLSVSVFVKVMK